MCGITGILRFNQAVEKGEIERMTFALAHRGPDGAGIWCRNNAAIGHRRLSIIDLETGKQPMCNEDETVWITFNGEIYNFLTLRDELVQRGHRFGSHSDTEVILHAYEEWGDECVSRFRGMFAFAIIDTSKKRLFLARDHLGIKPLVYYHDPNCFAFGSEIQAVRAVTGSSFDLDLQAIDQYLLLQYIPAPRSVFKQVRKLPPAHRMSVTFDGRISEPEEYWRVRFNTDYRKSESEWLEELDEVLRDSVKAHLVADVPFGAFLSGGVDSSTIVAYMAQELKRPVKTFSIGFEEDEFSEISYAEVAARRWGTEHHVEIVKPDALAVLPELVKHYGEPFGDSSAIPTYYVCRMARKHVPMVLSGDGGDEAFAGYHSYAAWMRFGEGKSGDTGPFWKRALYPLASALIPARYPPMPKPAISLENWLTIINYMPAFLRKKLWRSEYREVVDFPLDLFHSEYGRTLHYTNCHKAQHMDLKTYLPFDILTKVDIASMIHSLEVRTPIVDKKVVEFAATMPETVNMRKDRHGRWQGKRSLKNVAAKYYAEDFLHRKKMGFGVPIRKWFSRKGSLYDEIQDRLIGSGSTIAHYFDPKVVRHLVKNNVAGPLWLLLFLEEWLRQNRSSATE